MKSRLRNTAGKIRNYTGFALREILTITSKVLLLSVLFNLNDLLETFNWLPPVTNQHSKTAYVYHLRRHDDFHHRRWNVLLRVSLPMRASVIHVE